MIAKAKNLFLIFFVLTISFFNISFSNAEIVCDGENDDIFGIYPIKIDNINVWIEQFNGDRMYLPGKSYNIPVFYYNPLNVVLAIDGDRDEIDKLDIAKAIFLSLDEKEITSRRTIIDTAVATARQDLGNGKMRVFISGFLKFNPWRDLKLGVGASDLKIRVEVYDDKDKGCGPTYEFSNIYLVDPSLKIVRVVNTDNDESRDYKFKVFFDYNSAGGDSCFVQIDKYGNGSVDKENLISCGAGSTFVDIDYTGAQDGYYNAKLRLKVENNFGISCDSNGDEIPDGFCDMDENGNTDETWPIFSQYRKVPLLKCGDTLGCAIVPDNPVDSSFPDILSRISNVIFWIIISGFVLMVIIGGFMILASGGNQERVSKGKGIVTYSAVGLVVAFLAKIIYSFIQNIF